MWKAQNDCVSKDIECEECEDRCSGDVWVDFNVEIAHLGTNVGEFNEGTRQYMTACGEKPIQLTLPNSPFVPQVITANTKGNKNGCKAPCCGGNNSGDVVFARRGSVPYLTFKWTLSVKEECGDLIDFEIVGPTKTGPADGGITMQKHWIRCF